MKTNGRNNGGAKHDGDAANSNGDGARAKGVDFKAEDFKVVGKPFRKVDARSKCVGATKFADDIALPRMLYCKLLRSHVPHALIKSIDVSKALALPGVHAVITGKDLPIPYGILPVSQDEHALCVDKVRYIGD